MNKFFALFFIATLSINVAISQETISKEEKEKQNWFHQNFSRTGIFGFGTDDALEFLNSKGLKPKQIVVAVLDSGVEIDHEDLKDNIWNNPKEIPNNNKDDDNNGFIDDIHGWDFLGGKNGDYNDDNLEFTRIFGLYKEVFSSSNKAENIKNIKKYPKLYQTYLKARKEFVTANNKNNETLTQSQKNQEMLLTMIQSLKEFTGNQKITKDFVTNLQPQSNWQKMLKEQLLFMLNDAQKEGKTLDEIAKMLSDANQKAITEAQNNSRVNYQKKFNEIAGDNPLNFFDKNYGNNEVEGIDAMHGTHVAGIIAATRNNGIGMNGVAGSVAKIMSVRIVPDGDERDKNIALGIRYAADNGAKILNMSFGKAFSPYKDEVWKAIEYAKKKGVLLFHSAGNSNKDLDYEFTYPTNYEDEGMENKFDNFITVGASTRYNDKLKASFSNYGTIKVDFFSPGQEIYATIPDGKYRYLNGTSMATPAAVGCAAVLWSYFPNLTYKQIKDILMQSVNISNEEMTVGAEKDKRKFSDLSLSGGVIDLYKAVQIAYNKYGK